MKGGDGGSSIILILIIFWLYALSFTLVITSFPTLLLELTGNDVARSSMLYGLVSCIRYSLEFFSSPWLRSLSDKHGRRPIVLFSLFCVNLEFFLLSSVPSVSTLILSRCVSGLGDGMVAMMYAMVTDKANANGESVTEYFGSLGAVFGLSFIVGPFLGSFIAKGSVQLCFFSSGVVAFLALIFAYFFLEETNTDLVPSEGGSQERSTRNAFSNLRDFFSNANLRTLCVPYVLTHMSLTGVYHIWILYMGNRFHVGVVAIGAFLSVSGLCTALVQGLLIKYVITVLRDEQIVVYGVALCSLQLVLYGLSPNVTCFYLACVLLAPGSMWGPSLTSVIVRLGDRNQQGTIQGALGSLRTVTSAIASLVFPMVFSSCLVENNDYKWLEGAPFYLAALLFTIAGVLVVPYLRSTPHTREVEREDDDEPACSPLAASINKNRRGKQGNPLGDEEVGRNRWTGEVQPHALSAADKSSATKSTAWVPVMMGAASGDVPAPRPPRDLVGGEVVVELVDCILRQGSSKGFPGDDGEDGKDQEVEMLLVKR